MAGSKSVAGRRKCLYRNLGEPKCFEEAVKEAEEVMRQYVISVVGPTRIRGVNRVMSIENVNIVHSKGLAFNRKEDKENDAIHRNG